MPEGVIPYGRQDIGEADIEAVVEVLRSDWLTQGPGVPRFEEAVAGYCGAVHGVAVNSATSALHLACLALGLGPGTALWTTPNTFVASANCALYCGAEVDFVDIDPNTWNMSVEALAVKLEAAEQQGSLPRVVVPVHFAGRPCDMEGMAALAQRYGFALLEDASHAIGARYRNEPVGNCRHSAITVFSFHPVKIITTGEGGVALSNDRDLHARMALLRSHGITREAGPETEQEGPWYYRQTELGYNYRMTDIQAALGRSQMARLDDFVARRARLAERYRERLAGLPLQLPAPDAPGDRSAWHLFVVRLKTGARGRTRRQVFESMRAAGIGVNVHYIPVHTQPFYRRLGFSAGDFPEAEAYYGEALTLPLYPALTEDQQDRVVDALGRALA